MIDDVVVRTLADDLEFGHDLLEGRRAVPDHERLMAELVDIRGGFVEERVAQERIRVEGVVRLSALGSQDDPVAPRGLHAAKERICGRALDRREDEITAALGKGDHARGVERLAFFADGEIVDGEEVQRTIPSTRPSSEADAATKRRSA